MAAENRRSKEGKIGFEPIDTGDGNRGCRRGNWVGCDRGFTAELLGPVAGPAVVGNGSCEEREESVGERERTRGERERRRGEERERNFLILPKFSQKLRFCHWEYLDRNSLVLTPFRACRLSTNSARYHLRNHPKQCSKILPDQKVNFPPFYFKGNFVISFNLIKIGIKLESGCYNYNNQGL